MKALIVKLGDLVFAAAKIGVVYALWLGQGSLATPVRLTRSSRGMSQRQRSRDDALEVDHLGVRTGERDPQDPVVVPPIRDQEPAPIRM